MSDLTIFPADIAEMSVSQLAALPPAQPETMSHQTRMNGWNAPCCVTASTCAMQSARELARSGGKA